MLLNKLGSAKPSNKVLPKVSKDAWPQGAVCPCLIPGFYA